MDVRTWFNRVWPARVHLIPMLRDNPDHAQVRVYGTHSDPAAPALTACDVVGREPGEEEAFFDFAIDFCQRHDIDVIMPSSRRRVGRRTARVSPAGDSARTLKSISTQSYL
ncbi:hypothetical protein ACFVUN_26330 [Kitasatospora griseola]|uniref:hypothetical protein n=1 Tax=Kitasatospora griseola TaxID=2064 RepID=UPI0036DBBFAE